MLDIKTPKGYYTPDQGYLIGVHTAQELIARLETSVIEKVATSPLTKLDVFQAYNVAPNLPFTVPKVKVLTLVSLKKLPLSTRVVMRYLHGTLFFFIMLDEKAKSCFMNTEMWFSVDAKTEQIVSVCTGQYSAHNALYLAAKYDNKETTLEKLLYSKAALSISTLNLMLEENENIDDIPL